MKTATKTIRREVNREAIVNDESKYLVAFGVGDVSHQGDLTIVGIAKLPKSAKPRSSRQLTDGRTQGSRHVMERGNVYDCDDNEVVQAIKAATKVTVDARYIGPVFVSPENPTADDLSHPEHGNQGFPAGTICAVVIQRSLDAEEREQRVLD